jgi:hypothetical protein
MVVRETPAAVTNCEELRRLLSSRIRRREMAMPIGRFIIWVGTSLLALLFVADWCLPKSLPESAHDASNKPIIRIASIQQPPERVAIDTRQPTIVPPPTLVGDWVPGEPSPLQSHASTVPPPTAIDVDKKRRAQACGLPTAVGEQSCCREWRLCDPRLADQIILHGYYFGGEKKPVQPALKPRLVEVSSMARPIRTIIAVGA